MKAIVLGRNYTSRLGMIRALGSIGHEVYVIYTNKTSGDPDFCSKYVKKVMYAREPDEKSLVNAILTITTFDEEKTLLFPIDDFCAYVVDKNLDSLKEHFVFQNVRMTSGNVIKLMNKDYQKSIAKEHGLKVAEGNIIEISDGHYSLPLGITYPCFVKPLCSALDKKSFFRKCETEDELLGLIASIIAKGRNAKLLVEEYIHITNEYATVGFCDGKNVYLPAMIKMQMDGVDHHRGVTIVGEVLPPVQYTGLFDKFSSFMLSTGFVGLFDIDSYESNGTFYFNELNLRLGASGWAVTSKGVNLAAALVDTLCGSKECNNIKKIDTHYSFTNEKGLMELFYDMHISYKKYKSIIHNSDVLFVHDIDDIEPYVFFEKKLRNLRLKRFIKCLILN